MPSCTLCGQAETPSSEPEDRPARPLPSPPSDKPHTQSTPGHPHPGSAPATPAPPGTMPPHLPHRQGFPAPPTPPSSRSGWSSHPFCLPSPQAEQQKSQAAPALQQAPAPSAKPPYRPPQDERKQPQHSLAPTS